jgi:hypothetical protein
MRSTSLLLCLGLGYATPTTTSNPIPDLSAAKSVAFESTDGGLPWPLPDNNDLMTIMIHGVHCKFMTEKAHNTTDMEHMHLTHCNNLVDAIEQESKGKMVSKEVCGVIFKANANFDLKQRLGSYSYYFDDVLEQIEATGVVDHPTYNLPRMSGYNYGNMLMKEWHASHGHGSLTAGEKTYLGSWMEQGRLEQAAIAYTCQREHGIGFVVTDSKAGIMKAKAN